MIRRIMIMSRLSSWGPLMIQTYIVLTIIRRKKTAKIVSSLCPNHSRYIDKSCINSQLINHRVPRQYLSNEQKKGKILNKHDKVNVIVILILYSCYFLQAKVYVIPMILLLYCPRVFRAVQQYPEELRIGGIFDQDQYQLDTLQVR